MKENLFDVIIIGGSYAGLSAAMSLGRSTRRTMVIDSGAPCNRQTPHSHNFLTRDGSTPAEIAAAARKQVEAYPTVKFLNDLAIEGRKTDAGFEISTASGRILEGKKLILATGIKDIMPDIEGFRECWGISVIHCPYCHGYEFRGRKTAVMTNGARAMHLASLVRNLTRDLTILTSGAPDFSSEDLEKLTRNNIRVIPDQVAEILHHNGHVRQLVFGDGARTGFDAVYAGLPFRHHTDIHTSLGCALNEQGYIRVDHMHKTTVPGVFACGDTTSPLRSVANAVATGNFAGAVANSELAQEEF